MAEPNSSPSAPETFLDLAEALAQNFLANAGLEKPQRRMIVVLGSGASDHPFLPPWTKEISHKILDAACNIFKDEKTFLRQVCRTFSDRLGRHRRSSKTTEIRDAIVETLRIEELANVACLMPSETEAEVRRVISEAYRASGETQAGQPPHLPYEILAHFVMHGFVNDIVTMNFDEMLDTALENELGPAGFKRMVSGMEPLEPNRKALPRLFKIHGTASSPESLRFTSNEVSVLTTAQERHLDALIEEAGARDCKCLDLVSFGYSWKDPDLTHWLLEHRDRFNSIFIIRWGTTLPEILEAQCKGLTAEERSVFRVLSIQQLCGLGAPPLEPRHFWWCLAEEVWKRPCLAAQPLIPISRHLLLGVLLGIPPKSPAAGTGTGTGGKGKAEENNPVTLRKRVRLEILLYLLKSKGMINTLGMKDSPRIRAYFSKLREQMGGTLTIEALFSDLGLTDLIDRSPEPAARDTLFAVPSSKDALLAGATATLVEEIAEAHGWASNPPEAEIEYPLFREGRIQLARERAGAFIGKHVRQIFEAPEIEISRESNFKLEWIFSSPAPLTTFPQFATAIRRALDHFEWTHLLLILESKQWISYPWSGGLFGTRSGRKILMILPSLNSLDGWGIGQELRGREARIAIGDEILEVEVPWWRHNRHLLLPLRITPDQAELGPGLFFQREVRSPAVAPVRLTLSRDKEKLLATFLLYYQRATSKSAPFAAELCHLVETLLQSNSIVDEDMRSLVESAFEPIKEAAARPPAPS